MAKKDLKYFMRNTEPEIVTAPGPDSFRDDEGNPILFEIKVLTQAEIQKINDNYRKRSVAVDRHGNPLVSGGEVVWKTEKNNAKSTRHMIVEALQYPDLKSKELMDHYKCVDVTDMPLHVFSRADEYSHVVNIVLSALGLGDYSTNEKNTIEEAKN